MLFTRLLERLDCLDIDAMSEVRVMVRVWVSHPQPHPHTEIGQAERDEVRPKRKALVKRCEALSAQATQGHGGHSESGEEARRPRRGRSSTGAGAIQAPR